MFSPDDSSDENLKFLVERLIEDIINVMKDLEIDRVELSLLKLILLFDSGKLYIAIETKTRSIFQIHFRLQMLIILKRIQK